MRNISKRNVVVTLPAAFVAVAATVALGMGPASADAKDIKVSAPLGGYGTGCTYKVSADVSKAGTVFFYDWKKGSTMGTFSDQATVDKAGRVTFDWKPKVTGDRVLKITHDGVSTTVAVKVVKGTDLGSVCVGL